MKPSTVNFPVSPLRRHLATRLSNSKKIEKLADRQNRTLGKLHRKAVKVQDDLKMSGWVNELLSMGPKHSVRDKFNEVHFLADINNFMSEMKKHDALGGKLCEIEAAAKWYTKKYAGLHVIWDLKKLETISKTTN